MFLPFFLELKAAKVPVSLGEFLSLLEGLQSGMAQFDAEEFYYLARTALVKDERHIDRFDQVFAHVFRGVESVAGETGPDVRELPADWLEKLAEKHLSAEDKAKIAALGGFEKLMETLRQRLEEQKGRHQGGSKWIGTAGTSPFGAYGYNPEGVRIGQDGSRNRRAAKVWDRREFRNFDDSVELGTRNIKVALKRLRRWVREGAVEELDLPGTIHSTAEHGYLDVKTRPERRNAVRLLVFLDAGGSMDDHVQSAGELFSALRSEFKHLDVFYFHNCLYERVWRDNRRRHDETIATIDILHRFSPASKVIVVGDASMSPSEIAFPGGSSEHWNDEAGAVWLGRLRAAWPGAVWLNPLPEAHWDYTRSIQMIREQFEGRMFPLTLAGLSAATKALSRKG